MSKKNRISDVKLTELSMIMATGPDGQEWAPRNADAIIIGTKGGPVDNASEKPGFLDRFVQALKKGFLVNDDVPDNIDGDGDGGEDYEQIVSILYGTYGDLQQSCMISDNDARSVAVCTVIDNMLERLDDVRSGGDGARKGGPCECGPDCECATKGGVEKAGAKLSAATKDKLAEMSKHADAIKALHAELVANGEDAAQKKADGEAKEGGDGEGQDKGAPVESPVKLEGAWSVDTNGNGETTSVTVKAGDFEKTVPIPTEADIEAKVQERVDQVLAEKAIAEWIPGELAEDGLPDNIASLDELVAKAKKSKEPYGDVEYADPGYQSDKKKRYPIDTEEHARAAWSYINKESNAEKYSSEDLAKVKAKIKAAAKKFGIDVEAKGAPVEPDLQNIVTSLAETLKASFAEQFNVLNERITEMDAKVEAQKAAPASPLSSTVAALKAAQASTSPGGLPLVDASDQTYKANPIVESIETPIRIDRNTSTVADLVRARTRTVVAV